MTDNVIKFPSKKILGSVPPGEMAKLMMQAALEEADKYGYDLLENYNLVLDFEVILILMTASLARGAKMDNPFIDVLDTLIDGKIIKA